MNEPMHPENAGTEILQAAKRQLRKYQDLYAMYATTNALSCQCDPPTHFCARCSKLQQLSVELKGLLPT